MAQKYVQLMEDLQYTRRQAQSWKQKHLVIQQQLLTARQQAQQLKKTLERLQDTNARLADLNRQLSSEKESIITDYTEEVTSIKDEIAKKQREILQLKESTSPTLINHQLAIRQLKFELDDHYQKQSAAHDKKLQELSSQLQRQKYERQLEKEKASLKVASLQTTLRELEQRHQQQISTYSAKLFQMTHPKPPEERELLRRTKRDNEELKKRLDLATSDLSTVLDEKNQLHKDYAKWMKDQQKLIADHQSQISAYKAEIARITALLEQNTSSRDQSLLKDRDRDIKRLKGEAELLRDQLLSKQQKISELQVEKAKLQAEIKSIRSEQERHLSKLQEASQWERDRLQKEIIQARHTLERIKGQNLQLNDRIYEASRATSEQRKKFDNIQRQEEQQRNKLKRQLSEKHLPPQPIVQEQKAPAPASSPAPVNQNDLQIKQLEEALRSEKGKLREFLTKYVELKKKYESCEKKLKKANQKIMELLQTKIILGSPKANPHKHFQFPTQPRTQAHISPPRNDGNMGNTGNTGNMGSMGNMGSLGNMGNKLQESRNQVLSSMNLQGSVTTANFKSMREHSNSKTNPPLFNPRTSPPTHPSHPTHSAQPKLHIRIEDQQEGPNDHSYYERSIRLKTQQFKELKCTNHQHD